MMHKPAANPLTVVSVTEQIPGVIADRLTGKPELAVAEILAV
jgi:hypothetical protein